MGVYLMSVHLTGVRLMGIYFMGVHLMGVDLMGVDLMGVDLMGVDLMGVDLMGVDLMGVDLMGNRNALSCSSRRTNMVNVDPRVHSPQYLYVHFTMHYSHYLVMKSSIVGAVPYRWSENHNKSFCC